MRTLFTLFFLCIASFGAQAQWRNELYLLGGAGKNYSAEIRQLSGNFGMSASTGGEVLYFNAGVSLYYLSGEGSYSYWAFRESTSRNFVTELAIGGGLVGQIDNVTLRFGPDIAGNVSLSNGGLYGGIYFSFVPKAILTFDLGNMDLGVMAKASFSLVSARDYSPGFYGGGLILGF